MLGGLLSVAQVALQRMPSLFSHTLLVAGIVWLFAMEARGKPITNLAGNLQVPAQWVVRADFRAGMFWGAMLGTGIMTLAPRAILYVMALGAIAQDDLKVTVLAPMLFAVVRASVGLVPATRRWLLNAERRAEATSVFAPARLGQRLSLAGTAGFLAVLGLVWLAPDGWPGL